MGHDAITAKVRNIMIDFADQTGLTLTKNPPRRYLWTDAHAVCNFLTLYRLTGEYQYKGLALILIEQVHNILGMHREDDSRRGWISGLSDNEGAKHPTAGGLRIGKELNERGRTDVVDERLEWDRDGQYFHYLTKWMHALCRASDITRESQYCRWAMELAKAAHAGFTVARAPGTKKRLLWKMSIDLSYPLVPSTGLHDPLDAYITYDELCQCAAKYPDDEELPDLDAEIIESIAMIEGHRWGTDDPLGIGGLLFDACRVFQLTAAGNLRGPDIREALIRTSTESLISFASHMPLSQPAEYRLAFRELGLSIGLRATAKMQDVVVSHPGLFPVSLQHDVEELREFIPLGEEIERFWCQNDNQQVRSWLEHGDINRVMLATSLLPKEFLTV
jgi:hypothetical protein